MAHAIRFYARFNLSLRQVEEMLRDRGIHVSYENIRLWTAKFSPQIAGFLGSGRTNLEADRLSIFLVYAHPNQLGSDAGSKESGSRRYKVDYVSG
ncbi:hypothetical protein ACK6D9_04060 [Hoeflea sp. Naph1]|uniref:hypothetical protein n=1 Tax=Hoeflea sp. Naph1 TaxID=3388653 RepID=UPI00398FEDF2